MATTPKVLFRGAAETTNTTLYTTPSATTTVVTSILVANTSASAGTFDLSLDGIKMFDDAAIAANSTAIFDMKQVLIATDTIQGLASATTITFHISGVEIA
jgi:hypothetical protein